MTITDIANFVQAKLKEIQMSKLVDINSAEFENRILAIFAKKGIKKDVRFIPMDHRSISEWILDTKTGLEWGPSSPKSMTHKEAIEYCSSKGGHLPTREELQTILDITKHQPCIDTSIFSDTKNEYYWTSDVTAWNPNAVWCVSFSYGYVGYYYEDCNNYVRPVRSSQ